MPPLFLRHSYDTFRRRSYLMIRLRARRTCARVYGDCGRLTNASHRQSSILTTRVAYTLQINGVVAEDDALRVRFSRRPFSIPDIVGDACAAVERMVTVMMA